MQRRPFLRALPAAAALLAGLRVAQAQTAAPAEVASELPGARLQGSGLLRFFGLRVYDIRLWTGEKPAAADWAAVPLALEIEYARSLVGKLIAERSLTEMRRQADIAPEVADRWLATMTELFPDVKAGDRLTGVQRPGAGMRFFLNGTPRGEVRDAEFARLFVGIWLSARTSEPALRDSLFGPQRS